MLSLSVELLCLCFWRRVDCVGLCVGVMMLYCWIVLLFVCCAVLCG